MRKYWFAYFGLPEILQSDNGNEFKNALFVREVMDWDGDFHLIYRRPRHPQTQGLAEQSNGTVETRITSLMEQNKTKNWPSLLPRI